MADAIGGLRREKDETREVVEGIGGAAVGAAANVEALLVEARSAFSFWALIATFKRFCNDESCSRLIEGISIGPFCPSSDEDWTGRFIRRFISFLLG